MKVTKSILCDFLFSGILSQAKVCLGGAGLEGPERNDTGGPPGQVEPAVSALPLDPEGSRALDAEHELGE